MTYSRQPIDITKLTLTDISIRNKYLKYKHNKKY